MGSVPARFKRHKKGSSHVVYALYTTVPFPGDRHGIMAVERVYEEPHTRLVNSLIRDPDLSDAECRVYLTLLSYRWQNDSCFPGQKRIGADIGKSERGVRSALIELEKKGLIKRRHRGQRYTDEYTFPDRQSLPFPHESAEPLDRQILPFPNELERQNMPHGNPDRQNPTSPERQETTVKEDSVEKDSVVKPRRPANPIIPTDCIEDRDVRDIAVALEQDSLKQKEIARIRKEIDRSIYSHLDFVKVAEGYVAWQETKPEKKRDTDRVSAFIHQLEYKRTYTAYFKETEPRPTYSVKANVSTGGYANQGLATPQIISPRTVVRKSKVPEWDKSRQWIVNCGTCRSKDYNEFIDQLQPYPPKDGKMCLAAPNESIRESVERRLLPLIDDSFRSQKLYYDFEIVVAR